MGLKIRPRMLPPRGPHGRRDDAVSHVSHRGVFGGARRLGGRDCLRDVRDPPVDEGTVSRICVGHEGQFVPGDAEAHVEGFVDVRLDPEQGGSPPLRCLEVRGRIDDGAETFGRDRHAQIVASGSYGFTLTGTMDSASPSTTPGY